MELLEAADIKLYTERDVLRARGVGGLEILELDERSGGRRDLGHGNTFVAAFGTEGDLGVGLSMLDPNSKPIRFLLGLGFTGRYSAAGLGLTVPASVR